jgi:hypothetical protein
MLIENVAIAGFHLKTDWSETFYHHKNPIHDNGWDHIKMQYAKNSWVQSIIHDNATTALALSSCINCSVFHCQIRGNPGHNGFVVTGASTRNLLYHCKGGTQMHTFSISGFSTGNVFFNCYAGEPSAIDCHSGLTLNNLFDNIYGGTFRHGGAPGAVPPSHARGLTIWNWKVGYSEPYKGKVYPVMAKAHDIPGFIFIGLKGIQGQKLFMKNPTGEITGTDYSIEWGLLQQFNQDISPASLYQYQLHERIGKWFPLE